MEKKFLKAWGVNCTGQLILALLFLFASVLLLIVLAILAIQLNLPYPYESYRSLILPGGFAIFLLLALAAVITWGILSTRKRARQLDAVFLPHGLKGKRYLFNGRQYHGTIYGRQVDIYIYRGPTIDIFLRSSILTRLVINQKSVVGNIVAHLSQHEPMLVEEDLPGNLQMSAIDPAWARRLFAHPDVRDAINRLSLAAGPYEISQVIFQPGVLLLRLYRTQLSRITPEKLQAWIWDLTELLDIAESLPPPVITAEPSRFGRNGHHKESLYH